MLGLLMLGLLGLLRRRVSRPLTRAKAGLIIPGLGPDGSAVHGVGGLIGEHRHGLGRQQIHAVARNLGDGGGEGIARAA